MKKLFDIVSAIEYIVARTTGEQTIDAVHTLTQIYSVGVSDQVGIALLDNLVSRAKRGAL